MQGRVGFLSMLVCVLAALLNWKTAATSGVAVEHRNRRSAFQSSISSYEPPNENIEENESLHSNGHHVIASMPRLYPGSQNDHNLDYAEDLESGPTIDNFEKRGPSSYKLKYGGLGKRKPGSNKLRFGGLGKRLSAMEENGLSKVAEDQQITGDVIGLVEREYDGYVEPRDSKDRPMRSVFDPRRPRKMGKGYRYSGLGKRMPVFS